MKQKIFKTSVLVLIPFISNQAMAYCGPPPTPIILPKFTASPSVANPAFGMGSASETMHPKTTFWDACYASVSIQSFGGQALNQWNGLKTIFQNNYNGLLIDALNNANKLKLKTYSKTSAALLASLKQNYQTLNKAKLEIKLTLLDNKLDFVEKIEEQAENEKNYGAFNDGNGDDGIVRTDAQSYKFFKDVCKRNKMFSKTSGAEYNAKRSSSVNKSTSAASNRVSSVTGSTNEIATSIVKTHASKYCTAFDIKYNQCVNPELHLCIENDLDSGVCKGSENVVFEMTDKDTNAINLVKPKGYDGTYTFDGAIYDNDKPRNRIEDELFDVDYTYTPEQYEAANDFSSTLIFQPSVIAPTIEDKETASKADFVSEYNRYLSVLNVANYSFTNAIQSRKDLELDGEIPMSERDVLKYLINSFGNPEALIASKTGKKLSSDILKYQLLTIKNKLELEKFEQSERIEVMLAALLAAQVNNPDLINKLNSLK